MSGGGIRPSLRGLGGRCARKILATLVAACAIGTPASGPGSVAGTGPGPEALARLEAYARGLADAGRLSGVVLVAQGDQILFHRAYGLRDAESEDPMRPDTRFDLASAGKMFTAVAVLQQVAAGRATLDTPVGAILRDYPNRTFAEQVTIRHLLTHSGGAGGIDLFGIENSANRARATSVADMVALHADRPPDFPPGSDQSYDNFGMVVLGRMVEHLSGLDYETYLHRYIFAPAGMTRTGFVDCVRRDAETAVGTVEIDGVRRSNCATQPARGLPAGGQIATAADMHRFVRALQTGRLLPPALFAEATRTHRAFMGLGVFATDYGKGYLPRDFRWGHGGSSDGVCTDVRAFPATGEIVVVLTNDDPPLCFRLADFLHRDVREASGP